MAEDMVTKVARALMDMVLRVIIAGGLFWICYQFGMWLHLGQP